MADHALIDQYLTQLRHEVRWLRDVEDIVEEVADHLMEAVAVQVARGHDAVTAQMHALGQFGDPTTVGRSFAATGGTAMPTTFTRRSGVALLFSAFLFPTAMVLFFLSDKAGETRAWEGLPQLYYSIGGLLLGVAAVLLSVGILGLQRRHGGALGLPARVALVVSIPTALVAISVSWAFVVWTTGLLIVSGLLATSLRASGDVSMAVRAMLLIGPAIACGATWWFETQRPGNSTSEVIVAFAGLAVFSLGLAMLGRWLSQEAPADAPADMAAA